MVQQKDNVSTFTVTTKISNHNKIATQFCKSSASHLKFFLCKNCQIFSVIPLYYIVNSLNIDLLLITKSGAGVVRGSGGPCPPLPGYTWTTFKVSFFSKFIILHTVFGKNIVSSVSYQSFTIFFPHNVFGKKNFFS